MAEIKKKHYYFSFLYISLAPGMVFCLSQAYSWSNNGNIQIYNQETEIVILRDTHY